MDSDTMFEARLVRALRDYTDQVVLPFDPDVVAEQAIGLRRRPMRLRVLLVPLVALALLLALAIGVVTLSTPDEPAPSPAVDAFNGGTLRSAAGSGHSATLLPDGRVLVISGTWRGGAYGATVNSAELWDPVEGSSTPTGRLVTGRPTATATLLSDGRVLVVGGFGGLAYPSTAVAAAEVWDAASDSFREAGELAQPRVLHTATLLQDGRVLVIGGDGPDGQLASAEVWDPTTERFRSAGSLAAPRTGHTATPLADGRVLVLGGSTSSDDGLTTSFVTVAELWDPSTESSPRPASWSRPVQDTPRRCSPTEGCWSSAATSGRDTRVAWTTRSDTSSSMHRPTSWKATWLAQRSGILPTSRSRRRVV